MAKTKAKRVVVALRLSTQAGQRTLRGIFRFLTMRKIHWDIRLKRSIPTIFLGVLIAGAIMTAISYGFKLGVNALAG